MNDGSSKLDMILENKVVQKLKLENNVFNKKWCPKLIFLNEKNKINKILSIFDIKDSQILIFKVRFWLFLTNCHSSADFFIFSFEHVDSRPKIWTHHV